MRAVIIIGILVATIIPLSLAIGTAADEHELLGLNQIIFNTQISVSDVIIGTSVAIVVAFLVLSYEHKQRKDPLKQALQIRLERLENQMSASRDGIIQLDNRNYLRVYLRGLEVLSLSILEFYGADDFEMFSQLIERVTEALNQERDYSTEISISIIDFLTDLTLRH